MARYFHICVGAALVVAQGRHKTCPYKTSIINGQVKYVILCPDQGIALYRRLTPIDEATLPVMTEETVIAAAVAGDPQAFAALLDGQYNRIYKFAYRWCGNNVADAEDITQLACIKLAKSIGQFRGDSAFSTWLYRLVVNCAKDWQKSQQRHQGDELTDDIALQHSGDEAIVLLNQVLKQVDAMGEGFKESALLVLAEGFSHKEAADMLGVKESTISWRLHEMRQRLAALEQAQQGSGRGGRR
jgi:RNA polymerase sigma-70 factor (ECF subfamily)